MDMKRFVNKLFIPFTFCLILYSSAFAQLPTVEINKAQEIKFLESSPDNVKKIFSDYPFSTPDFISTENAVISIDYSTGNCSDKDEEWDVPKGKVISMGIDLRTPVSLKDLRIDLSKFVKEKVYNDYRSAFLYHNKAAGIAYSVYKGKVGRIIFIPAKENYSSLCNNEKVRQFYYSNKSWFYEKLKQRQYIKWHLRSYANVTDLILSTIEITADCSVKNLSEIQDCSYSKTINVETKGGSDDPTDVLTYEYEVSGGRIVGSGANVIWDLSGAKAGTYKIAAGINNGCGICGRIMTKTVVVKDCLNCSQK